MLTKATGTWLDNHRLNRIIDERNEPPMTPHRMIGLLVFITVALAPGFAQQRIAVLPFRNMDHDIKYNVWSIEMADSLHKALLATPGHGVDFVLVPSDSIELAIAELNLDPMNPQYESDIWKAIRLLNVTKAVQGNFQLRDERVLINCYVYDMSTMLSDNANQAKDLFKSKTTYLETIRPIVKRIYPGLK